MEAFGAVFAVKDGSRIVIDEVLHVLYVLVAILGYWRSFGHKSSYKAILVFVASSLRRAIGVAIVHRRALLPGVR